MSLEIRQLVLKATVTNDSSDASSGFGVPGTRPMNGAIDPEALKAEIMAACRIWLRDELRQEVRQELRQQQER